MALLWENLTRQLDSVRAGLPDHTVVMPDCDETREQRLQKALAAIKDCGNPQIIESLKAAIEGRQANLDLPDLPVPGQSVMSGPEAYLAEISDNFKPNR